ncbi:MAG: endopeptidase La [Candidatus Yanofskybacteria bacterium RIFCSPLOWO2_01_FULL_41_34]|nr:MAG: endopeptidase La [Candidatus Yanofskybacteria bacterium RIFCSPLOWO2_01_FULL_41_34]
MHPKHQIVLPVQHVLINLGPSIMVMPGTWSYIRLDDHESSSKILTAVKAGQAPYVFAVMSDPQIKDPPDRFYKVGVVAETRPYNDDRAIVLGGLLRAEITKFIRVGEKGGGLWMVSLKKIEDENHDDYFVKSNQHVLADMIKIRDLLRSFVIRAEGSYLFDKRLLDLLLDNFENTDWGNKDAVDNFIWSTLHAVPDLLQEDKQPILESMSLPERIELCIKTIKKRLKLLEIQKENMSKDGKLIRRARKTEVDPRGDANKNDEDDFVKGIHVDIKKRWEQFKLIRDHMNEDAGDVIMEDLEKLKSLGSPQGNNYEWPKYMRRVDFILGLPWKEETVQEGNISKVAQILDEDHFGLVCEKDSICDQVAPKLLNPGSRGSIICLVGPPGTGKTSLAKSIARALNRKYIRMSLGGVRDEAQIRGHGITYVGAEPGEILKLMKRCGVKNPLFVIDEIDKLGQMSTSGDPSAAMLEVLDPEQNGTFKDHFVACGFDLSRVMFIATANQEHTIHPALRDRMDVTRLPGYLEVEKVEIAKRHLIPRLMKDLGLIQNNVEVAWEEGLISKIIRSYTNEAGVRNIERALAKILKKICRAYLKSKNEEEPVTKFNVTEQKVHEYLGPPKFTKDRVRPTKVGEAIGLAWTPVGGDILYVQVETYPRLQGKKVFARTGMQGKVMEESDEVALTLVRNRHPELSEKLSELAIHLHIPNGAVPKDGPSAGITIVSALESEITNKPIKFNLAMTGEIDLKGRVLAVGGIREKIVAAEGAGIESIIMPKDNERNLHDVPEAVKDKLIFHFVESIDEVLENAFPRDPA